MENIPTTIPLQRRTNVFAKLLKMFLGTQFGKYIGFVLGLRGFNRQKTAHFKFLRIHNGEKLRKNELLFTHQNSEDIPEGQSWVYEKPVIGFRFNSRVDKGAALQASLMSGSSLGSITSPLPPKYIALSTSSLTPAAGDTTLTGETSVAGIARALGTVQNYVAPASVDAAASYDVYKSFTLTGSATTVVSSALLDAASVGNMFVEANLSSSAVMATNDILQVTWTVNI